MAHPVPPALVSRNPLQWVRVFGPGAIIASLTIGTGELIFSSRGGVIFGYSILMPFLMICVLKWALAYSAARHMVLSGVHPLERWMDLPVGPRGWLTVLFFLLAAAFLPVWVSFHASVLGDFLSGLTGTKGYLNGGTIHLWGVGILLGTFLLALAGGYAALEKTQIGIISAMLAAVIITLVWFGPDWFELLSAFFVPQRIEYPAWLTQAENPAVRQIASRSVWVELSLYIGVIGGAGYDYLAYASYLRDKRWGNAAPPDMHDGHAVEGTHDGDLHKHSLTNQELRQWLRAPLIDCTLSFLAVLVFSAVFVAAGKLILGPARQVPSEGNFLEFQSQFVTHIHPQLFWLYVAAAFLAMFGTLYGTLEVGPTVIRETMLAARGTHRAFGTEKRLRSLAIGWCTAVALIVLLAGFAYQVTAGKDKPPGLLTILTPVNFFTSVLAPGLICLLNPWMDRRLPAEHRMPMALAVLNLIGGIAFTLAAIRAYWSFAGWWAIAILLATLCFVIGLTWFINRISGFDRRFAQ
jgi:Mn2+/Fe2+ NRAMP family transporter